MTAQDARLCTSCGAALAAGARYCPRCGAASTPGAADEIALPGGRRLHLSPDTLSLRELLAVVEAGVAFWRRRLVGAEGVAREQAAAALQDLSQILESLARQLAQGRETVRITARLPAQRHYARACALCGRGNRESARFCTSCGAALRVAHPAAPAPAPPLELSVAVRSDVGQVRPNNEDTGYAGTFAHADGPIGTLLLVADGMGGAEAGDVASYLAAETVKTTLRAALEGAAPADDAGWQALLRATAEAANRRVYAESRRDSARRGMGTTLTIALIIGRRAHVAHVGDSRAYLVTPGPQPGEQSWAQLTNDHTVVARLVDIGQLTAAEARSHPQRNMIYRSLGTDPQVDVDTLSQALAPGDGLLLCSDGLTGYVEDEELARMLAGAASPASAGEQLVALANARGGRDNITVVIARARADLAAPAR